MTDILTVREIITAALWVDGSGWSYKSTIENHLITTTMQLIADADWSFLAPEDLDEGEDIFYVASYYAADDEDLTSPLAVREIWHSDLTQ